MPERVDMGDIKADKSDIIGRARKEGGQLFREWFNRLDGAEKRGEPVAYVFVMGSVAEILRALDFHLVFPEINSLQTAVKKVSLDYLNKAEDYGYSPDVCSYVKADVGVALSDMQHPMATIPRPSLAVATNLCTTYIKWAEFWERFHGCPVFTLDFPGMRGIGWSPRPGDEAFKNDVVYMKGQLEELIELAERVSGKKFRLERLAEVLHNVNRLAAAWKEVLELNKARPAPFNAMTDGLNYMGILSSYRGTETAVTYMERVIEELHEKIRKRIGILDNEKFRLMFVGTSCYMAFSKFVKLFEDWGGVFVNAEYLAYAGGGLDQGIKYDLSRPLESLAEQLVLTGYQSMSNMFFSHDQIADTAEGWGADAVIYHTVKSCRTVSTSLADSREYVLRKRGIPSLLIESDLVDPRCWSEAQMKNRIDAFFESLQNQKILAEAGKAASS